MFLTVRVESGIPLLPYIHIPMPSKSLFFVCLLTAVVAIYGQKPSDDALLDVVQRQTFTYL